VRTDLAHDTHQTGTDLGAWALWLRCMAPELFTGPVDLTPLSPLERRTLYCQLSGHFHSAPAIAEFLGTTPGTVRGTMIRIRQKIEVAAR